MVINRHARLSRMDVVRLIGATGTAACMVIFIREPSFPNPDKLLVFLTFVFMMFGQAREMLKRLLPFVTLLVVYESFRGLVPSLNNRVYYGMAHVDTRLFGQLPTAILQHLWWHGRVEWYDFMFYLAYMLHFVIPLVLAIVVWKQRDKYYWQFVTTYVVLSFAGFLTFLVFPAAPPWMASDQRLIPHIERISSHVWFALGLHDFPSIYSKIAPNPVAAVPSLHSAYASLFAIFIFKFFGKKWGLVAGLYPLLIYVGVIYMGEHYFIDVVLGIIYAFTAYYSVAWLWQYARSHSHKT